MNIAKKIERLGELRKFLGFIPGAFSVSEADKEARSAKEAEMNKLVPEMEDFFKAKFASRKEHKAGKGHEEQETKEKAADESPDKDQISTSTAKRMY